MFSRFAQRERRITAAIDKEYGERTRILPKRRGEFLSAASDPARPARVLHGIADFMAAVAMPKDTSRFDGMQPMIAAEVSHVSYDDALFNGPSDWPKAGDTIELLDRPQVITLVVAGEPSRDGLGRVVCKVSLTS